MSRMLDGSMGRTFEVGERVGAYEILTELGSGGMAELFLGRAQNGAPVAIKGIRPEHTLDPAFVAMFVDEAHIVARIEGEQCTIMARAPFSCA